VAPDGRKGLVQTDVKSFPATRELRGKASPLKKGKYISPKHLIPLVEGDFKDF
jgi:hypothetical protein